MPRRFHEFWYTQLREKSTAAQCQSYGANPEHRTAQKAVQIYSTLCEPKTFSSCKLLAGLRLTKLPVVWMESKWKKPSVVTWVFKSHPPWQPSQGKATVKAICSGIKICLDNWCTHRDHNLDFSTFHSNSPERVAQPQILPEDLQGPGEGYTGSRWLFATRQTDKNHWSIKMLPNCLELAQN